MGLKEYAVGFVIGAGIFGIGTAFCARHQLDPRQVIVQQQDFNQDGVADLVVEKGNGIKVPMYGIREGENIRYVTGDEMKKRNPDSITDYNTIVSKLNKE
jgi:hypothetical protein